MNILVLGCGKIGSRHIQSLAHARYGLRLYAADNSDDSLARVKNIFNKVSHKNRDTELILTKDISEIRSQIDIVIIASNSRERSGLIRSVLANLNPKHIILEKVLFDKISDYSRFNKIFEKINTKVWVNEYMGYEFSFLSKYINASEKFQMKVSGNWGLCCNSVHFIEIFHYLCGRITLNLKDCSLSDEFMKSKREGYYELFGTVNISSSQNHALTLVSNPSAPENIINIEVNSGSHELKDVWVDDYHNCVFINNGKKLSRERYYARRQSERTLEVVESLIKDNYCNLPTYHHSSDHHMLTIDQFKKKFNELGIDTKNGIPIT